MHLLDQVTKNKMLGVERGYVTNTLIRDSVCQFTPEKWQSWHTSSVGIEKVLSPGSNPKASVSNLSREMH